VVVRRDDSTKTTVAVGAVVASVADLLETIQHDMLAAATSARDARIVDVTTIDDAREAAATGFARIAWRTLGLDGESALRESSITVRCLRRGDGSLPDGDDDPEAVALVARAY
jgi:prolyl-tRNA synthetase